MRWPCGLRSPHPCNAVRSHCVFLCLCVSAPEGQGCLAAAWSVWWLHGVGQRRKQSIKEQKRNFRSRDLRGFFVSTLSRNELVVVLIAPKWCVMLLLCRENCFQKSIKVFFRLLAYKCLIHFLKFVSFVYPFGSTSGQCVAR